MTGIMAGVGEAREDLRDGVRAPVHHGVDEFAIGRHVRPRVAYRPVVRWIDDVREQSEALR